MDNYTPRNLAEQVEMLVTNGRMYHDNEEHQMREKLAGMETPRQDTPIEILNPLPYSRDPLAPIYGRFDLQGIPRHADYAHMYRGRLLSYNFPVVQESYGHISGDEQIKKAKIGVVNWPTEE
jgi:hypothetical protein